MGITPQKNGGGLPPADPALTIQPDYAEAMSHLNAGSPGLVAKWLARSPGRPTLEKERRSGTGKGNLL